jgi:hypothetical protein
MNDEIFHNNNDNSPFSIGEIHHDTTSNTTFVCTGPNHWSPVATINHRRSLRIYTDDADQCRFCQELHCIIELKLRPIFLEMDAFINYAGYRQQHFIENACISIDISKSMATYNLGDIVLCTFTFDGRKQYYFGDAINLNNQLTTLPLNDRMVEVNESLNTLRRLPKNILYKHGVEIVG